MFTSNKKTKGITLAEVLFSVAIMALVVTGVLVVFVQTVDMSKRINYDYTAVNIAKSRIERARTVMATRGFASLTDLAETDTILDQSGSPASDGDFKRSTIIATNYDGNSRMTQIDVKVTYKYRGEWKDSAAVEIPTVFANIQD